MTKKRILVIAIITVVILSLCGGYSLYKNYQEKEKIKAQNLKLKEEYEKKVTNTNNDYKPYLNNELIAKEDEISKVFNQVINENNKNIAINYNTFLDNNIKKINLTKLSLILDTIEQEINNYNLDFLNIDINNYLNSLDTNIYDEKTLIDIFNSHELLKNKELAITKRQNYLNDLTKLKEDITKINEQSNLFYFSNNKYIAKNETVVNNLNNFSNKYKLNLNVEKEFTVPILCYHGVLDNPWGISSLFVRVSEFESQMKYLSENGYTPLFVSEIANAKNYEKPIILTFDDGYTDVYTNAFPILKKYNIKANVYMISGWINGEVYMTTDMTKEMSASPLIEIGSHTVDHKSLATLTSEQIDEELRVSKETLENMLGTSINVLAYPKGSYDSRVMNIAKKYYKYALSTNKGEENPDNLNKYALNRIYVYRGTNITEFKNLF